jgi:uncharacterized protein YndB with AHSA1/START domain
MTTKELTSTAPAMRDDAVKAKTGKTWKEWFSILDRAGARKMSHQEIVKVLHSDHNVGPWWTQMVTVTYEQSRGLRDKHQRPDGYQISVSRTVNSPISKVYKAFASEKERPTWLGKDGARLTIRTATPNKSMRVTWHDQKTSLEVGFIDKGAGKSQVVVQHSKLPDDKSAARMKTYWAKALDRLKETLE